MGGQPPDLRQNIDLGMERQRKILDLMTLWYRTAAQTDPPPVTDPSILSYNSRVSYYYTAHIQQQNHMLPLILTGLNAAVSGIPGVVLDHSAIANLVAQSLADTTQNETGQGYSTCVMSSFLGRFMDIPCLYRPMVVVVSFNFSASEYQTSASVAAFGYWIYLFVTALPFFSPSDEGTRPLSKSVKGELLSFQLPDDMTIVGKRWMTQAELDAFSPATFTRDH
ncbi:hypothetical protein Clacol_000920 [Clathrus columnatus]|uniref:Uncharacterized protein n=1 Tax=Clathrus columnatus TaxID=1419009 RepID=A0AAV5A0C5_9AGAM|nr:hypothetical protein Clacol_000920 [Clathrus columnatus]